MSYIPTTAAFNQALVQSPIRIGEQAANKYLNTLCLWLDNVDNDNEMYNEF